MIEAESREVVIVSPFTEEVLLENYDFHIISQNEHKVATAAIFTIITDSNPSEWKL